VSVCALIHRDSLLFAFELLPYIEISLEIYFVVKPIHRSGKLLLILLLLPIRTSGCPPSFLFPFYMYLGKPLASCKHLLCDASIILSPR
jgi:hypothetical protein